MRSDPLVVAGIAAALIASTSVLIGLPLEAPVLFGIPAGVALVYRFDRTNRAATEDRHQHHDRRQWMQAHPYYVGATTVLYAAVGGTAFWMLAPAAQAAAAALVALGGLYVWPLRGWRLKRIGAAKTIVVTLAWSAGVTVLPLLHVSESVSPWTLVGLFVYRAGWLFPNILCSDWADRASDREAGLVTLAHRLGRRGVQHAAAGAAGLAALSAGGVAWATGEPLWLAESIAAFGLAFCVFNCPKHPDVTYRLTLDLYMALPGVIALISWAAGWL